MPLKVLNCALVFLNDHLRFGRSQIPAPSRFGFFFREYSRYSPDLSFLIIVS